MQNQNNPTNKTPNNTKPAKRNHKPHKKIYKTTLSNNHTAKKTWNNKPRENDGQDREELKPNPQLPQNPRNTNPVIRVTGTPKPRKPGKKPGKDRGKRMRTTQPNNNHTKTPTTKPISNMVGKG